MEGFGRGGENSVEDPGIKPVVIREICELAGKYNVDRVTL